LRPRGPTWASASIWWALPMPRRRFLVTRRRQVAGPPAGGPGRAARAQRLQFAALRNRLTSGGRADLAQAWGATDLGVLNNPGGVGRRAPGTGKLQAAVPRPGRGRRSPATRAANPSGVGTGRVRATEGRPPPASSAQAERIHPAHEIRRDSPLETVEHGSQQPVEGLRHPARRAAASKARSLLAGTCSRVHGSLGNDQVPARTPPFSTDHLTRRQERVGLAGAPASAAGQQLGCRIPTVRNATVGVLGVVGQGGVQVGQDRRGRG